MTLARLLSHALELHAPGMSKMFLPPAKDHNELALENSMISRIPAKVMLTVGEKGVMEPHNSTKF
ncbi:uncharacterized protein BKA78DRAFT_314110 [Phyllosticta capitalensis]|uniref:uncharacterized protein n=1 Tax=Phyllosticta capitalensis TaxID=121624 RepID=UPI00312FD766